jgi:GTP cyclohydrolase I
MKEQLPDIQHSMQPEIKIPINQVGVSNVKVPIILDSMYGGDHELVAKVSMCTDLDAKTKGISMSMLLRTLVKWLDRPLKHDALKQILQELKVAVETNSQDSYLKFEFDLPISVKSPKSGYVFPQYYPASFEARLIKDQFKFYEKVKVFYSSYCPCSASLCEDLKSKGSIGYPHAQRSSVEILVEVLQDEILWLEEIIKLVEDSVKTIPYPIIRRVDEQEIARIAGENLMFVEDAIRRIAQSLDSERRIYDWIAKCIHEESIHCSDAVACNWKGIEGGFDGRYFL